MSIIVSGATGLLGSVLCEHLKERGLEVIRLARSLKTDASSISCDLVTEQPTVKHPEMMEKVDTVVHLAAIAHPGVGGYAKECRLNNVLMLKNMLHCMEDAHWIYASSVRVYDKYHKDDPISVDSRIGALDEYAESKIECEKLLLSKVKSVEIMRLAPVFNENNLGDFKKRIFLPGGVLKASVTPCPRHSFCHTKTFSKYVAETIRSGCSGQWIQHCVDGHVYSQDEMLDGFPGLQVNINRYHVERILKVVSLIWSGSELKIRNKFDRFFVNNVYTKGRVRVG